MKHLRMAVRHILLKRYWTYIYGTIIMLGWFHFVQDMKKFPNMISIVWIFVKRQVTENRQLQQQLWLLTVGRATFFGFNKSYHHASVKICKRKILGNNNLLNILNKISNLPARNSYIFVSETVVLKFDYILESNILKCLI
jgi:hypothetical protein